MREKLTRVVRWLLAPPDGDGPKTFTLAVPDAQSTFKRGAVGWANRPPARVRCPTCGEAFVHRRAMDIISCPRCRFERHPDEFDSLELLGLTCPECEDDLNHGVRHPHLFDDPQWAACRRCQYHWEYLHL